MRGSRAVLAALLAAASGCGSPDAAEEQAHAPTSADSAEYAATLFDASAFDSVTWETTQAALDRGGVVFRFSCRKCHGEGGAGDGGFVADGDTLRPPSFLDPAWQFADDLDGLRQEIYTGTGVEGMPHWGLEGLKYRDIDAVAKYLQSLGPR